MYPAYQLGFWLSNRLPRAQALRLAEALGGWSYRLAPGNRHAVEQNIGLVAGNHSLDERDRLTREVFRNFGRYLVEFSTAHRAPSPDVTVDGWEHLTAAQAAGRGVLILTGHFGNWELGAAVLRRRGVRLVAVALPHAGRRMNALFDRQRSRLGVPVIPLGRGAAAAVLRALRQEQAVAVVGDQEFGRHGVPVALCGRWVIWPAGPATLSLRSGAPVVPSVLVREGPWRFRLCLDAPIWPDPGMDSGMLTQRYAAAFERRVTRDPAQWLLFRPVEAAPDTGRALAGPAHGNGSSRRG